MTVLVPSPLERDPRRLHNAVRQLAEGRSNATGLATLATSATSTTVTATNCSISSIVILTPTTSQAAAETISGNFFVKVSDVRNGSFVITHTNTSTAGRSFFYATYG